MMVCANGERWESGVSGVQRMTRKERDGKKHTATRPPCPHVILQIRVGRLGLLPSLPREKLPVRLDGVARRLHLFADALGELEPVHEGGDVRGVGHWIIERKKGQEGEGRRSGRGGRGRRGER